MNEYLSQVDFIHGTKVGIVFSNHCLAGDVAVVPLDCVLLQVLRIFVQLKPVGHER